MSYLPITKYLGLLLVVLSLIAPACQSASSESYTCQAPVQLNDGLETSHLGEAGIDSAKISKAISKIRQGKYRQIHSLLIYKGGKLVLEEYFQGYQYEYEAPKHRGKLVNWHEGMLHSIMSDTKSITLACVGIAIDKGFIKSAEQSIFDYLPDHQHLRTSEKEAITIQHLLTMTPGLHWYEWGAPYTSPENPVIGIWYSDKDPVSFILEGRLEHEPGTHYSYFGGNHILLGEIVRNATGMPIDEFSQQYLFDPLGIDSVHWSVRFPNGVIEAAGGLKMRPRDMLKVGITFLNRGIWQDNRILSDSWIEKSTQPVTEGIKVPGEGSDRRGYTYSWWTDKFSVKGQTIEGYHAGGWGGQKILVIPQYDAVIVFTGGDYNSKVKQFRLLEDYILPAMSL